MILELLNKRCSVRDFSDKKIPEDIIDSIIEAGRLAPSGGNEQSWKFGVITNKDMISDIAEISYNQSWIKTSPLLIVLCTVLVSDEKGGRLVQKKRFPRLEDEIENMDKELYSYLHMEEHQTKIPGTQMMMYSLEHGIYSTWVSYFDVERLGELLGLPEGCVASEVIAFGYPEGETEVRDKKSRDEVCFFI